MESFVFTESPSVRIFPQQTLGAAVSPGYAKFFFFFWFWFLPLPFESLLSAAGKLHNPALVQAEGLLKSRIQVVSGSILCEFEELFF